MYIYILYLSKFETLGFSKKKKKTYLRDTFTLKPSVLFLHQHNQKENLILIEQEQKMMT